MTLINKKIYIYGGNDLGGPKNDFFSLDLSEWTWNKQQAQGPFPSLRRGFSSTRVGRKIYISSGCDFNTKICYSDTYYFDTETNWWTKVEDK